jgi:hypothetical protein
MKQWPTQRNTISKQETANEYISTYDPHDGHKDKSLMDWLVCHCSPNTHVVYHTYDDSHWPQPNTNDVCTVLASKYVTDRIMED